MFKASGPSKVGNPFLILLDIISSDELKSKSLNSVIKFPICSFESASSWTMVGTMTQAYGLLNLSNSSGLIEPFSIPSLSSMSNLAALPKVCKNLD